MNPHETIARMRAYQAALELVRLDIQSEQQRETDPDRIDELVRTLGRRGPARSSQEVELDAIAANDNNLAILMKYANEISRLSGQLQRIIENPVTVKSAARDKLINYSRLRAILRRALHRDTLEFGWLLAKTTEKDCPQELHFRAQELIHRLAEFSRALHFHTGSDFRPLSIHMLFLDRDP